MASMKELKQDFIKVLEREKEINPRSAETLDCAISFIESMHKSGIEWIKLSHKQAYWDMVNNMDEYITMTDDELHDMIDEKTEQYMKSMSRVHGEDI